MKGKRLAALLFCAALLGGTGWALPTAASAADGEELAAAAGATGAESAAGTETTTEPARGSLDDLTNADFAAAAALREQGDGGWYYLYGDASRKYYRCREEGGIWKTPDDFYAGIADANGIASMHPAPDYDMIKAWRTDRPGRAQIGAYVTRGPNGDGVRISASLRRYDGRGGYGNAEPLGEPVFVAPDTAECEFYREAELNAGDLVFFCLNKVGDTVSDSTAVKLGIRFSPTGEAVSLEGVSVGDSRVLNTTGYFSDVQGGNNWFYAYGRPDAYVLMEYGMGWGGERLWHGFEPYSHVGPTGMHPGSMYGSMRIFVADRKGVVAVEGSMGKADRYGDGVNAGVYHNNRAVVERFLAGDDDGIIFLDERVAVERGDTLVFYVDSGNNKTNNNDSFQCKTEVYWTQVNGEPVAGENLSQYLRLVSPLELAGGTRGDGYFGLESEREPKTVQTTGCSAAELAADGPAAGGAAIVAALLIAVLTAICLLRRRGRKGR